MSDTELSKQEKALRKLEEARGLLDPSDRYRALVNAVKQSQDLIEMGDKKARFALVIMSVLNAVAVLLVARGGSGLLPTGSWALLVAAEVAVYAVVTLYFLTQAVSALRPRGTQPPPVHELPSAVEPGTSMRVLFHADAVARPREAYHAVWDSLRMDNLTTELVDQLYALSWVNQRKYAALDRLYFGLNVLTWLLGVILATLGVYHVTH